MVKKWEVGSYTISWNKNRNPRSYLPSGTFEIYTYDGVGFANDKLGNIIADGLISNLRMTVP